jgi:hypothetical protein
MSYFAKFVADYRPVNRPRGTEHKFATIQQGTKVSVMEEYIKDGEAWCRLEPPLNYLAPGDDGYPEPWVPRSVLTTMFGLELPPAVDVPATPGAIKSNALEVAEAWKTAVYKTLLFLKVW